MKALTKLLVPLVALIIGGCADKPDDSSDFDESNSITSSSSGSTKKGEAKTVADLGLSSALKPNRPSGSSLTSFGLQSGLKSYEKCQLEKVNYETFGYLTGVAVTLCHIEAESAQIEFGKKYSMEAPTEEGEASYSFGIFVDDSVAGQLTVNICENGNLDQKFTITSREIGKAKGYVQTNAKWDNNGINSLDMTAAFDNGATNPNVQKLVLKSRYENGIEDVHRISADISIDSSVGGITRYSVSQSGNEGLGAYSGSMVAVSNSEYGQIFHHSPGGSVEEDGQVFTYEGGSNIATFDSTGYQVPSNASVEFGTDGELQISIDDLPPLLPDDFQPVAVDDEEWNCVGEEALALDIPDASEEPNNPHVQCDAMWQDLEAAETLLDDCDASGFGYGEDVLETVEVDTVTEEVANAALSENDL
jgi:hypothetical protein